MANMEMKKNLSVPNDRFYYDFTADELKAIRELISDLPKSAGKEVIQDILTKAQNELEASSEK